MHMHILFGLDDSYIEMNVRILCAYEHTLTLNIYNIWYRCVEKPFTMLHQSLDW